MTCGIWDFHPTTQKSENFTPMGYFCQKYMKFELKKKKEGEELSLMALKSDAKLEKPWHCGFKNGMKNWDYFHH